MREVWAESSRFDTTSQRLADQARMILRNGWSSDLKILEISGQVNNEEYDQDPPFQIKTLIAKKQEPLTQLKHKILQTDIL